MTNEEERSCVRPSALAVRDAARRRSLYILVTTLVLGVAPSWARAAKVGIDALPDIPKGTLTVELQTIATGLAGAADMTHAGDGSGRMFVANVTGEVQILQNGTFLPEPYLDVTSLIQRDHGHKGLLGMTFHPGYSDPLSPGYGKFYTHTSEPYDEMTSPVADFSPTQPMGDGFVFDHQSLISEWTVDANDPNRIDPNISRKVLMRINQPRRDHNGGGLAFGPDDYLYVPIGNGLRWPSEPGRGGIDELIGNSQDTLNIFGNMLRIDTDFRPGNGLSTNGQYAIPNDNPFLDDADFLDEIYAYGLRNPWRISFDSVTGTLTAGDVGQNRIEEVNVVVEGGNYGWWWKEGSFWYHHFEQEIYSERTDLPAEWPIPTSGLIDPLVEYDHQSGLAAIGGFVYRGSALDQLEGLYLFGEHITNYSASVQHGRLLYTDLEAGVLQELIIGEDDRLFDNLILGFGQGPDGELYVMSVENGPFPVYINEGTAVIRQIIPALAPNGKLTMSGYGQSY